ncbi:MULTISPECIES: nSTAND1 domain-containing NTPase [unclassified Streptomyces]|uniref:nSTAND1 domain-containing NTPase n=1 Tax=unclassified Streptomyces TaxID=2593676 RepID=UPI002E2C7733|nr:helix-turn-helix domain-containing protein [Streptomyces sp. NBC_00223]
MDTAEEFARALDALRRASGKSYRALADECGLGFNTIAGYCSGRHLPQLAVHAEFAALLAALGVPAGEPRKAWLEALRTLPARARRGAAPTWNPYRGLEAFGSDDAGVFFGREALSAQLVDTLAGCRRRGVPLVVVGPSGSGKSSLLRAGLLPRVGPSVVMTPSAAPLRQWASHAAGAARDAVVLVDQFEELFTLCAEESERLAFMAVLLDHPGPVVLGLRADFYSRALRYPRLAVALQQGQVPVGPMAPAQLREVIVEPARLAGLELEDGLVELLLADATREVGLLPLLSYTLQAIVELARAENPRATSVGVRHYRAAGGVRGAIAQTAEVAFLSLPVRQQPVARHLFLRLVKTDDSTADTRRRVAFDELLDARAPADPHSAVAGPADATAQSTPATVRPAAVPQSAADDDMAEVLDVFVTRRLLTAGEQTVEIAHEALLAAWPRLRGWLEDDREGHRVHGRLTAAARAWRDEQHPAEGLYRGGTLAAALEWAAGPGSGDALNPLERQFLTASSDAASAREAAERRRVRRRYQMSSLLMALVLVAAGAGAYAHRVGVTAHRETRTALSRQTAERADRLRDKDPGLAAQLALAAYRTAATPEARASLLDSSARPTARRLRADPGSAVVSASTPSLVAVGTSAGRVRLWRPRAAGGPVPVGPGLTLGRAPAALALSADGTMLAAGDSTGRVTVWRVADPSHPVPVPLPSGASRTVLGLAFSANGRLLAASGGDGTVRLWRVDGEASAPAALTGSHQAVTSVAFTPDGRTLAAGGDDRRVRLWDVSGAGPPRVLSALTGAASKIYAIAVSPDGHTLAAGTAAEHNVRIWDISDPARPVPLGKPLTGPASWINTVTFSPDDRTLAAGSADTSLWLWDLRSRQPLGTLPQPAPVLAAAYEDAGTLDTLAGDGVLRSWSVPGPVLTTGTSQVFSVSFDATGHRLLAGDGAGTLRLFDVTDPQRPAAIAGPIGNVPGSAPLAGASALTPDGDVALGGATDGTVSVFDMADPAHPAALGRPVRVARATIEAIALSADGSTAAVSADDGSVHLLDLADPAHPAVLAAMTGPTGIAFGVRFSPDGKLLALAGEDARGYLWNVRDRHHPRLLTTVRGLGGAVYATAFSHDGRLLAFGGADYSVRLVDLSRPDTPVLVGAPLVGPVGEIYELAFAPGDDRLAVSSIDHTVWLWDLRQPRRPDLLATLKSSGDGLLTVGFSPDGRTLAAGGRGDAVHLWNTDPDSVARWACATVGDPITPAEWARFLPDLPYTAPCR